MTFHSHNLGQLCAIFRQLLAVLWKSFPCVRTLVHFMNGRRVATSYNGTYTVNS